MTDPVPNSDAAARIAALDPTRSILLQAPAGSGKTTVLTQRFLSLLLNVDEVEEVVAITFTRKAAAEMRDRVMTELRRAEGPLARSVLAHSKARGWTLHESVAQLRIQTIDSLNRWLASRLPLGAGGAGDLAIADDPQTLYALAASRCVVDAERSAQLANDLDLIYPRLDNDRARLERLIALMLEKRSHWLPRILGAGPIDLAARVTASLEALLNDAVEAALQTIPSQLLDSGGRIAVAVCRARLELGHLDDGIWTNWQTAPTGALEHGHWRGLCAIAFTKQQTWRERLSIREGFSPKNTALKADAAQWIKELQGIERAQDVLLELDELPAIPPSDDYSAVLGALTRLLTLAASELEIVFREMRRVDYAYLSGAARQSLTEGGEPTDLALRLGESIRHLLVDEFQDTSIDQFTLLEHLTATWEPHDGRTLFVVGDPMQSIYLFRDAEVGLFLRARERGIGTVRLESLRLERNFRSVPALVEWTNQTFAAVFPQFEDEKSGAVAFLRSVAQREPLPNSGVRVQRVSADPAVEATAIAACVAELRSREPLASIAVLLQARAHAEPIVRALEARSIPCAAVDLITLRDITVVRDLSALARAIDDLADRTAWLGILRAPWCGLTLVDLSLLLGDSAQASIVWDALNDPSRVALLGGAAAQRVAKFVEALSPVVDEGDATPLASRIEKAWLRLGGPSAARATELPAAEAFFVAFGAWSRAPEWRGPMTLDARLAKLHAPQQPVSGAVQFMTVHRAKGLEFDKVIVPSLHRVGRRDVDPLLQWVELPRASGDPHLLIAPRRHLASKGEDRLSSYLKRLIAAREAHQRVRLLYVAATRARSELHLFAALDDGKSPAGSSGLATLWPVIQTDFLQQPPPVSEVIESTFVAPVYFRLRAAAQLPRGPADLEWRGVQVASYEPQILQGDAVDKLTRQSLLNGNSAPGEAMLSQQLLFLGVAPERIAAQVSTIQSSVEASRRHPLIGRWCFDPSLERESFVELSGFYEGRLTKVCVDARVRDSEGIHWMLRIAGGAPQSADDIAHQRELNKWRMLAQSAFGESFRCAIYYPRSQSLLLS